MIHELPKGYRAHAIKIKDSSLLDIGLNCEWEISAIEYPNVPAESIDILTVTFMKKGGQKVKNEKIELHDGRKVGKNEMITKAGEKELQGNRGEDEPKKGEKK